MPSQFWESMPQANWAAMLILGCRQSLGKRATPWLALPLASSPGFPHARPPLTLRWQAQQRRCQGACLAQPSRNLLMRCRLHNRAAHCRDVACTSSTHVCQGGILGAALLAHLSQLKAVVCMASVGCTRIVGAALMPCCCMTEKLLSRLRASATIYCRAGWDCHCVSRSR